MNESGNALASISAYYQIELDHIVVIHDDMDLDFGRIKVKAGGSAGAITASNQLIVPWERQSMPECAWESVMRNATPTPTTTR